MISYLDFFIPPKYYKQQELYRKCQLLIACSLLSVFLTALMIPVAYILKGYYAQLLIAGANFIVTLAVPLTLKFFRSFRMSAGLMIVATMFTLFASSGSEGGIYSVSTIWLLTMPIITTFFFNLRLGFACAAVIPCMFVTFYFTGANQIALSPQYTSANYQTFSFSLFTVAVYLLVYLFESGRIRANRDLLLAMDEVEQSNAKLKESLVEKEQAQREAEMAQAHTKRIFECLVDLIFVLDDQGGILECNKPVCDYLGFEYDEIIGRNFFSLCSKEQRQLVSNKLSIEEFDALISAGKILDFQTEIYTESGSTIDVIMNASTVQFSDQNSKSYLITCKDARDSKLLKDLKEKQVELIQSAKLASIGELSSGLAHEINNPLFISKGNINRVIKRLRAKHPVAYEEVEQLCNEAVAGCDRIGGIIRHFRDYSYGSNTALIKMSVHQSIQQTIVFMKRQLESYNMEIKTSFCSHEATILGDPIKFEQIMVNFIQNARDSCKDRHKEGKGSLKISTNVEGAKILVEIEDDGQGMTEETKSKIFDAFYTTKAVGKGTGLGMSISYNIIKEFSGDIALESEYRKGAKFILSFPMAS